MPDSLAALKVTPWFNRQSVRYIANGLLATGVHFLVLTFNLKVLEWSSAGLSNLVAALFGITSSFMGSRYFVFQGSREPLLKQIYRFLLLYAVIAGLHTFVMHVWVDVYVLNYIAGFVVATVMQVVFSYWGNKVLVFKA